MDTMNLPRLRTLDSTTTDTVVDKDKQAGKTDHHFGSAEALLKVQNMMRMGSLPKALHMEKHKHGCAYKESIRFLCGSLELNVRRELEGPAHVNAPVQVATPILPCTCGAVKED